MKRILLLCFMGIFTLISVANAQERTVSGKVTSNEDGSGLPGVNVIIKGTTNGTTTDIDGNFKVSVPDGATLQFSAVGFANQEVAIGARSVIDIIMALDVQQLSEVVVTAQGIQKTRNELAYSAQKVNGEDVAKTRDANFVNALSGKVAGLQITRNNSMGGSTNVVIRGAKSLTGNNQALFIVDGVPIDNSNTNGGNQQTGRGGYDYGNSAADINSDDIETINVLKGAAATALYGSRASNGVILITTKKGSKKGIGVTLNTGVNVGFVDKSTFADYQDQYGGGYGAYYESEDGYFLSRDIDGDGTDDLVVPMSEDASYGAKFNPNLLVYQWDAFDPTSPNYNKATPWTAAANGPSHIFQNPVATNNNVMIDGGNEKGYFKLGYTRNDEKGLMPNSSITKDFLNFGASYNLTDKLTTSATINFSNVTGNGRYGTGYDDKNLMTNFRQWWQTNVDLADLEAAYNRTGKNVTWNWADPSDIVPIYWDNPYFTRFENYQNDNRRRYYGNTQANYKVTDWLNVMGRVSLDSYNEFQEERYAVGSLSPSQYTRYNRSFSETNYDLMADMNKDITDDLNFKAVVGYNSRRTLIQSIFASTNGGLVIPGLYSLSNSLNPINPPTETRDELRVDGTYANISLGFKKMLFLDLAARRDVSSSLPDGNNVYYYPSVSGSFVFSELLPANLWLTNAKFRANYAEVGNTAPTRSLKDVYDKPVAFGSTPLFSVPGTKNNANLMPERTKSYEIGLEASFIDGRVGFDLTYYNQQTVDQIIPVSVSTATGYNSKFINAGVIENKGFELTAFGTPVKTDNFSWTVNVNWTRNRNLVKELPGIDNLQLGSFQGGVSINAALGQPYGTIRGQNYVFDDNGNKVVGANGYYLRSATANEIIGNINPDWIGGVNNTLKYKNLALSFLIDVKKGGDVFSLDLYYGLATGLYPETVVNNDLGNPVRDPLTTDNTSGGVILDGVKEDGTPNDVRVSAQNYGLYGYARNPAAGFVYDASYVKLRELALTYDLPKSVISKIGVFKGIEVALTGRNLWIIHKNLPYADPEEGLSSGNLNGGYQVGAYPTTRNVGFNLKLRF